MQQRMQSLLTVEIPTFVAEPSPSPNHFGRLIVRTLNQAVEQDIGLQRIGQRTSSAAVFQEREKNLIMELQERAVGRAHTSVMSSQRLRPSGKREGLGVPGVSAFKSGDRQHPLRALQQSADHHRD